MLPLDAGSSAQLFPGCSPTHAWDGDAARWALLIFAWKIVCKPQVSPFLSRGYRWRFAKGEGFFLLP